MGVRFNYHSFKKLLRKADYILNINYVLTIQEQEYSDTNDVAPSCSTGKVLCIFIVVAFKILLFLKLKSKFASKGKTISDYFSIIINQQDFPTELSLSLLFCIELIIMMPVVSDILFCRLLFCLVSCMASCL
jgi:hypothetical protein